MANRLAKKSLLVGWAGADWALCEPLLAAGRMPHLQQLMQRGSSGKISSIMPMLSPVTWTSVATGKRPYTHGIHGLFEPDPTAGGVRPASSLSRTTKAVWNIFTQHGLTAHVVGWTGAHPAEPISGINVTDRHAVARVEFGKPWPQPEGSIHPAEASTALASLRVHPSELDQEFLAFFVPERENHEAAKAARLSILARSLAATVTNHAAATWALEHHDWDLAAICYAGVEQLSHAFLHYTPPRQPSVSDEDFDLYQRIVPACYEFHDRMLGRLLELAGGDTTVILLSDHGCKTGAMRPQRLGGSPEDIEAWHRRSGLLVASGPFIKPGLRINTASILDVAPTLLTLFGLPVGADMDGRPLLELLHEQVNSESIPSWDEAPGDAGMHPRPEQERLGELQAMLAQLKEMGYRDPQEDQLRASQQRVIDRNQFNLARALIDGGRASEAADVLESLAAKSPSSPGVTNLLLEAFLLGGRLDDAERTVHQLSPALKDAPLTSLTLGRIELARRRPAAALEHLLNAARVDVKNIRVLLFLGQAYLNLRRWSDARVAFDQALALESDHAEALYGLCVVSLREGDPAAAVDLAAAALQSNPSLPAAYYHRGVALKALGRTIEAAADLEQALRLDPELRAARRFLARLSSG
jgi:predicted AlkP superfamily phosphohydrolase/phosphomutase/tetratricopeptide (TPR) repeat protein